MDKKTNKMGKADHKTDQPHAKLFSKTFDNKAAAKKYLLTFLPTVIVQLLDFRTLRKEPVSWVDERLKEHIPDIIYSCRLKGTDKKVYLNFLWEHKSYKPKFPHVQILRYLANGYDWQEENNGKLSLIVPLVLYHGREDWEYKPFWDYFELQEVALRPYLPKFDFILTGLKNLSTEEIVALEVGFLISTLLMFKFRGNKELLLKHHEELLIFVRQPNSQHTDNYIKLMFVYMLQVFKVEKQDLDFFINKIPENMQEEARTGWDIAMDAGARVSDFKNAISYVLRSFINFPDWTPEQTAAMVEEPLSFVQQLKDIFSDEKKKKKAFSLVLKMFDGKTSLRQKDKDEIAMIIAKYSKRINF